MFYLTSFPLHALKGEQLSPLDLCDDQNITIHELLTQHGGLSGTEAAKQWAGRQEALTKEEVDGTAAADDETLSVPTPRPTTPSRRSFVSDPVFESDKQEAVPSPYPSRAPTPATPPPPPPELNKQGPGILKKAFSLMRKKPPSQQPPDSILSSVVGLYAAQMTMLAAAVVGE